MRIIGGIYGGRVLHPPKGLPVRPTTNRVKEALFNALEHRIGLSGARVLDLFAGTGNVSLEFASWGAAEVVAVDQHPRCVGAIKSAARSLGANHITVVKSEVRRYIARLAQRFDIIFLDPPYGMADQATMIQQILEREALEPDGVMVAEHTPQLDFSSIPGFQNRRDYGSSTLSFFTLPQSPP